MNIRKLQPVVLAIALCGAMGAASAQQYGTAGAMALTPAAAKTAVDIQGNAALTSETAVAGTPIAGKPGTQSGIAVAPAGFATSMGAASARFVAVQSQPQVALSRTQLLALQRYEALR